MDLLLPDAFSAACLSHVLDNLSPSCLASSPHLQKSLVRVTSLLHSKDPATRWAAICVAHRLSSLSNSLLIDNAQSWVGIIFPSLLRPESAPILRASIRYLTLVLCITRHNAEFQRQVAIPMVPKVSSALLAIAEKHHDQDIKALCIETLARLVSLYPSSHKALSQRLFGLCSQIFNGSVRHVTDALLDATVNLYSVLHSLGGRVGGTNLWRNCLDDVLQLSWSSWLALRTTFPSSTQVSRKAIEYLHSSSGKTFNPVVNTNITDPLATIAHNLDSLKRGIRAIGALLRVPVSRPVKLPIGQLATFCLCLLTSNLDEEKLVYFDSHVRAAESAVVGHIWVQACCLLSCLAETARVLLIPHISRLIMTIASLLEDNLTIPQRYSFLRCAFHVLNSSPVVGAAPGINRLLKATIVILSPLYLHEPLKETKPTVVGQSKASKKRRREHEAESMLSTANTVLCATTEECDTLMMALEVVEQCLLNVELAPSARSLANRVLLSILLSLPSIAPSGLASDSDFHGRITRKVRDICIEGVQGILHVMSKGTSLVLRSMSFGNITAREKCDSRIDLLLHPRRPPHVRALPFVESLSLSSAEESVEETVTRDSLALVFGSGSPLATSRCPDSANQSASILDPQIPVGQTQEQNFPTCVEVGLQIAKSVTDDFPMEAGAITPPVTSPLQDAFNLSVGPPLLTSEKIAPMLVDESEQEEVPSIDLDSDSDSSKSTL